MPMLAVIRRRAPWRGIATAAAALLLASQLAAAAHTHQVLQPERFSSHAELAVDSGLCALCLLAFHAKIAPVSTPGIHHPEVQIEAALDLAPPSIESFDPSCALTRGPPAIA